MFVARDHHHQPFRRRLAADFSCRVFHTLRGEVDPDFLQVPLRFTCSYQNRRVLRTLEAAELPRHLCRGISLSSDLGGSLPPTRSVAPNGAPGFYIAGGCYKHFAPNGAMNPRLVQLNKLWDSSGTALGQALGQTSLLMSTVTRFVPEKSKKYFFVSFSKNNVRYVCCVSRYEYSTSVKERFTPDRRIERNVNAAVLAP